VVWNFMQIDMRVEDALATPMVGDGGMTREHAHGQVQQLLDRGVEQGVVPARTAALWRGGAKDDTVFFDRFVWTIYEYPDGEDPRKGALAWLEDYARIVREATGINVGVAKWVDG
jgi:hypothetical protein